MKFATNIVNAISASSLFVIDQMVLLKNIPDIAQNKIQPKSIDENFHIHSKYVIFVTTHHSIIIHNTTINNATAVPSLN